MTLTIGRFSTSEDIWGGTERARGDEVQFDSLIVASSLAEYQARVQQLRGLMDNTDETVFPLTYSEDSSLDGFYSDVEIEIEDSEVALASYSSVFHARMRRVAGGFAEPLFEVIASYVERTNAHSMGVAPARAALGLPGSSTEYDWPVMNATELRNLGDGSGSTVRWLENDTYPPSTSVLRWFAAASAFYHGAATVEIKYGSTYYPVDGSQIPRGASWRLSNGLIRVYPSTTAGNIVVETYDGSSAWEAIEYRFGTSGTAYGLAFGSVTVLRNDPTCCVIRFYQPTSANNERVYVTLSLSRGHLFIDGTLIGTISRAFMIERATAEAGTSITAGIRATANDAAGNRYMLLCPKANAVDTTQGRVQLSASSTVFPFMVSSIIGGSSPLYPTNGAETKLRNNYAIPVATSQRVVAR
jgi:hypothetical protein